jgi:hypothetical protein
MGARAFVEAEVLAASEDARAALASASLRSDPESLAALVDLLDTLAVRNS